MRFETAHFYAEQLGGSWTVRFRGTGELCCFRPTQTDAIEAMELLEKNGSYASQAELEARGLA